MTPVMRALLEAVRAAAVALVMAIDAALGDEQPEDPDAPCEHPEAMRRAVPVMGNPNRFHCKACDQILTEV